MKPLHDFRDIDLAEELSDVEGTEVLDGSELLRTHNEWLARPVQRIPMPWEKLEGRYGMAIGALHLLGGYSGHGKSTVALQMAIHAAKTHKVAVASLELPAGYLAQIVFELAAGTKNPSPELKAEISDWLADRFMFYDRADVIPPDDIIQMIIHCAKEGAKLVILDCLMMVAGICQDPEKEQAFTQTLKVVAQRFDIAILVVHHMRKPVGADGEARIPDKAGFIGSSFMVNVCHSVIVWWKDFDKARQDSEGAPVDDGKPDGVLSIEKNRDQPFSGRVGLWQHPSRNYCGSSQRRVSRIV